MKRTYIGEMGLTMLKFHQAKERERIAISYDANSFIDKNYAHKYIYLVNNNGIIKGN